MKLIISFSGRKNGNCDRIAAFASAPNDRILYARELAIHPCAGCDYECFNGACKYRADASYALYESMLHYDKVILIVPLYGGNPPSLYFAFHERGQDYFMHNDTWEAIVKRLYVIGVYGQQEAAPDFIPCLEKWFLGSPYTNRVCGIERHAYGQRLNDSILDVGEVRAQLAAFLGETPS